MTSDKRRESPEELVERRRQPRALRQMLRSMELSRRQVSLYGIEHSNSLEVVAQFAASVREFLADQKQQTCVLTADAVIVNENYFAASTESIEISQRMRARGAMAFTLVGAPPIEQLQEFIVFLNVEPKEVRTNNGPSVYLRDRGVSLIALTESVYTNGEAQEEVEGHVEGNPANTDLAVASAISWLTKQDCKQTADLPRLPITQILSHPDSAAKLICEAVTKLYCFRQDNTSGEIASEVIHDLKSLATGNSLEWDESAPQIRRAISKLPQGIRPSFSGFDFDQDAKRSGATDIQNACIEEVEAKAGEILASESIEPSCFEELFGAKVNGPLSCWRSELQPSAVMRSTGVTMLTLLAWGSEQSEHRRIAHALADLAARALDINDAGSALYFVGSLLDDANRDNNTGWRRPNIRTAFLSLDEKTLVTIIHKALAGESRDAGTTAAGLVELCPELATKIVDLLGTHASREFRESLSRALVNAGTTASEPLSDLLHNGNPSGKLAALETLIQTGRAWAVEEIAEVLKEDDSALAVKAIRLLTNVALPMVSEILIGAVMHPNLDVRCAALDALGERGEVSALPLIEKTAGRRRLFGGSKHEPVRQAALKALAKITSEHNKAA